MKIYNEKYVSWICSMENAMKCDKFESAIFSNLLKVKKKVTIQFK
jgi:hypothetical protein